MHAEHRLERTDKFSPRWMFGTRDEETLAACAVACGCEEQRCHYIVHVDQVANTYASVHEYHATRTQIVQHFQRIVCVRSVHDCGLDNDDRHTVLCTARKRNLLAFQLVIRG